MAGSIKEVGSKSEWDDLIQRAGPRAVFVDFTATWCGPCRAVAPIFQALAAKYTNMIFLKVDVDACADISKACQIRAMPTFQVYKQGQKVEEIVGADVKRLSDLAAQYSAISSSFVGQGRKLSDAPQSSQAAPISNTASGPSHGNFEGLDESAPKTTLQIRLADGSRLTGTFNPTHTVGDIKRYISTSRPGSASGQLMAAYPPKPLTDEHATLEQAGLLNAVIIQKP